MTEFYKYKGLWTVWDGIEMIPEAVYRVTTLQYDCTKVCIMNNQGISAYRKSDVIKDHFIPSGVQEVNWRNTDYKAKYLKRVKAESNSENNKVDHPSHYTWLKDKCGVEVLDITRHMDFCLGNAVKYILRAGHKSEEGYSSVEKTIEDLQKAIFYINDKINNLK